MAGLASGYQHLSRPIEELIENQGCEANLDESPPGQINGSGYIHCPSAKPGVASCDVLIIGSGYGGAIAAETLAGTCDPKTGPIRVVVFERGKEYTPGEFPESLGDLPGEVRFQRDNYDQFFGDADALFDLRIHKDVNVLVANGLGGGSLINANVALQPDVSEFKGAIWPKALRAPSELSPHFMAVKKLLGVIDPAEKWLRQREHADWMPKKYDALKRLAGSVNASAKPAPITVDLDKCTKCGNCITGCNVLGAKKTLPLTVLAAAKNKGAEIYTGANVLTVCRCVDDQAWSVRFQRTATKKNILKHEIFQIRAKIVILAAGALGSTEILLRSAQEQMLCCSTESLGKHFSTNGDMIAFGYAGRNLVNATGKPSDKKNSDPGPTITGYATVSFGIGASTRPVTIQDAAVPLALNQLFGEIVTTGSLLARYVVKYPPAWFEDHLRSDPDPLVVHEGAIQHSQVILAMGHDSREGAMKLSTPKEKGGDQHLIVNWPGAADDCLFDALHDKFTKTAYPKGGFNFGDYLPSPAWKSVPDKFEPTMAGGTPAGKLLSVHPLGGCAMSDCADEGFVNDLGQVFKSDKGAQSYNDLYVMDGAILPEALGVNPFLTISAIAHRNSQKIRELIQLGTCSFERYPLVPPEEPKTTCYYKPTHNPFSTKELDTRPIRIELRERLAYQPTSLQILNCEQYDRLVAKVKGMVKENDKVESLSSGAVDSSSPKKLYRLVLGLTATIDNLDVWLADPEANPICGKAKLYLDLSHFVAPLAHASNERPEKYPSESLFVEPILDEHLVLISDGLCQVHIHRDKCVRVGESTKRWWAVARNAYKLRKGEFSPSNFTKSANELYLTVRQHTHWRNLDYELEFLTGHMNDILRGSFKLFGTKRLGYSQAHKNPWEALLKLDLAPKNASKNETLGFHVDLNYLLKDGIPQVKESPHMPATLVGMARLGLFALRVMFQTHLWSFGAPDYSKAPPLRHIFPEASRLKGCKSTVEPPIQHLDLCDPPGAKIPTPYIRLARYAIDDNQSRGHLLLIHGLAHGGAVFATRTIDTPMTDYFVTQGYVVWVLDHRLSPALEWEPHRRGVTMDDLAKTDIPLAVKHIYNKAGGKQIDVFAHCIGAGAFAMATLAGRLHDTTRGQSMIRRATLHAVTPWLVASPKNRMNAKLAAFYKDSIRFEKRRDEGFDPIPPTESETEKPEFLKVLIDRVAGSLRRSSGKENRHDDLYGNEHMAKAICDRMALWYGEQWNHANVAGETHKKIGELVGFGNLEVFKHIYFCILRERLTDREGKNVYLDYDEIGRRWTFHTMFIHGQDNQVFSPASSTASAWKLNKIVKLIAEEKEDKKEEYDKPDVWHCKVPQYGHLDLVLGERAAVHVYPYMEAFFRGDLKDRVTDSEQRPASINRDPKPGFHDGLPPRDPKFGPILFRPKRVPGTSKVDLSVWMEPTNQSTSPADTVKYNGLTDKNKKPHKPSMSCVGDYGTYWIDKLSESCYPPRIDPVVEYRKPKSPLEPPNAKRPPAHVEDPCTSSETPFKWLTKLVSDREDLAFALGSCRYPGSPFERDASDKVFGAILSRARDIGDAASALDFALFVGDQIYADATANVFDTTEVVERYWERYRDAFGSPNMKELLKYLPTYFALDDHEFDDDWLGEETLCPKVHPKAEIYQQARKAAQNYQGMASHERSNYKFWHTFDPLGYPFFVMDTRTERNIRRAKVAPQQAMITNLEKSQWSALEGWLTQHHLNPKPKFIACGSPLAPPLVNTLQNKESWRNDDSWLGFPGTLARLVELIAAKNIQNVVLLGGDLHLSAYGKMTFKANCKEVIVHQIVASGLYVPLPFANNKPIEFGSGNYEIPGSKHAIEFCEPCILTTSPSHFLRVEVIPAKEITIQAYDECNNPECGLIHLPLT